jgi:hypothetical protein
LRRAIGKLAIHSEEVVLADQSKTNKAEVQFKKLQRAEDGKKAMSEYEAEGVALRERTAKLKAMRLARDASAATQAAAAPAKKKPAKAKKKSTASLSDWLKDQKTGGRNT